MPRTYTHTHVKFITLTHKNTIIMFTQTYNLNEIKGKWGKNIIKVKGHLYTNKLSWFIIEIVGTLFITMSREIFSGQFKSELSG